MATWGAPTRISQVTKFEQAEVVTNRDHVYNRDDVLAMEVIDNELRKFSGR